jgi:hypothetical protein
VFSWFIHRWNYSTLCYTLHYTGANLHSITIQAKIILHYGKAMWIILITIQFTIITIEVHITVCLCDLQLSPYRFLLQYVYVTNNYHHTGSYYSMSMLPIIGIKHVHITVHLCDLCYHHTGSSCSTSIQLTITKQVHITVYINHQKISYDSMSMVLTIITVSLYL